MALTDQERFEVWAAMMLRRMCPGGILKADFRAAINDCDDWADANAANFNAALPTPYRTVANADQKALLLAYVMLRRAGIIGPSQE